MKDEEGVREEEGGERRKESKRRISRTGGRSQR